MLVVAAAPYRWSEVTRRLELWVQILEINEQGEFVPVEVVPAKDVCTGGIFQLRQVISQTFLLSYYYFCFSVVYWLIPSLL